MKPSKFLPFLLSYIQILLFIIIFPLNSSQATVPASYFVDLDRVLLKRCIYSLGNIAV